MRNRTLTTDILADKLKELLSLPEIGSEEIVAVLQKELPSLSNADALKAAMLIDSLIDNKNAESVEIVTTTPVSFKVKGRKTRPVIEKLIATAQKSIVITGYSISDYFEELLKMIEQKSQSGIHVELFINGYESHKKVLLNIDHKSRRFFKVYEYAGKSDDKMAALHAKTIIVDEEKTLISSANLSYHGLSGNIEIGTLITSKAKTAQLLSIFAELKRQKLFVMIQEEK